MLRAVGIYPVRESVETRIFLYSWRVGMLWTFVLDEPTVLFWEIFVNSILVLLSCNVYKCMRVIVCVCYYLFLHSWCPISWYVCVCTVYLPTEFYQYGVWYVAAAPFQFLWRDRYCLRLVNDWLGIQGQPKQTPVRLPALWHSNWYGSPSWLLMHNNAFMTAARLIETTNN